jgi:hypothetical protein
MAATNGTILNLLFNTLCWAGAPLFAFLFPIARNAGSRFEFSRIAPQLKTGFRRFRFDIAGFAPKSLSRKGGLEHPIIAILSDPYGLRSHHLFWCRWWQNISSRKHTKGAKQERNILLSHFQDPSRFFVLFVVICFSSGFPGFGGFQISAGLLTESPGLFNTWV